MSKTQLTPFWFTPDGQKSTPPVEFHLRPLTQPQLVDVEEHTAVDGQLSGKAFWLAGTLGIIAVKNWADPTTGEPTIRPNFKLLPRDLVRECGMRLVSNDLGLDWAATKTAALGDQAAPQEDPEKN